MLVEGEWNVELHNDVYIRRRTFVDNVSRSPLCEVSISVSAIGEPQRSALSKVRKGTVCLNIFGNALLGLQNDSNNVLLTPIAIF